jgi:aldose 1-epimerase
MRLVATGGASGGAADVGCICTVPSNRSGFGRTPDGALVETIAITAGRGVSARIITYGATLQSLVVPDREGRAEDVVLGHADLEPYVAKPQYFGVTVGRYANRIANARFRLDEETYVLAANDGPNALHGGKRGFDKVVWTVKEVSDASVTLSYVSADGQEGFPGTLKVSLTYALDEAGTLTTRYEATTDKPTVVNLTNHSFFNLAGCASGRDALRHRLFVDADAYTPVDARLVPTGELREVAGTPFDFRQIAEIGARIRDGSDTQIVIARGYDHNFVLNGGVTATPKLAARLEDPGTGRVLELFTTEPGLQVYSGNFLDGTVVGKERRVYRQGDGIALEPQKFPNSPNQPSFPTARLDPGQTYRHTSLYRFSVVHPQ